MSYTVGLGPTSLPVTLRYKLTVDDMAAAMGLVSPDTPRRLVPLVTVVGFIDAAFIVFVGGDVSAVLTALFVLAAFLLALWFVLRAMWFRRLLIRWLVRRQAAQPYVHAEMVLTISTDGLAAQQRATSTQIGWNDVTGMRENDQVLLVMSGKTTRAIVPKRAFPNAAQLTAFRAAIAAHAGQVGEGIG